MTQLSPTPTVAGRRDTLAPGLLVVLQQVAAFRFALILIAGSLFMALSLAGQIRGGNWLGLLALGEAALFLVLVAWPRIREALGAWFLPLALGWLILTPFVEQGIFLLALDARTPELTGRGAFAEVAIESIWLAVPVILAAWQYGRRGWLMAVAALAAGHMILGLAVIGDAIDLGNYLLSAAGRLGAITFLGYIVMRLATSLQGEHQALVKANQQLALRAATMEQLAASRERNRLARDLHDTLAHSLTGLSVQLQAVETLLARDPEAARVQLKDAQTTARSGAQEARRAIHALRASPLEDLGLSQALRQLCRRQAERTGSAFTCDIDDVVAVDPLTEQAIYRVAEAALSNIEQHAAARNVRVRLAQAVGEQPLRLEVQDDGVGFDPSIVSADRIGLAGMAERAALVGGRLQVESAPRQGTLVLLEIGA